MKSASSKQFLAEVRNKSPKPRILKCIQQLGVATVKDISMSCEQSIPNVMHYIDLLLSERIITEVTVPVQAKGRKPKAYRINPDYGFIIGVELGLLHSARIGYFKLDGSIVHISRVAYDITNEPEVFIFDIINAIRRDIKEFFGSSSQALYIVIGNPGVISSDDGSIVLSSEHAVWRYLPLKTIFEDELHAPTKVINDVNLSTIGEKEFGNGKGFENFIFARFSMGLKIGIILKDQLYQGDSHAAGEIGSGPLCVIENNSTRYYTVESLLTVPSICKHIADELENNKNDAFYELVEGKPENVTLSNISKILGKPSYVNNYIRRCGELFGYVLSTTAMVLDISRIIIGGEITELGDYFFKPAREVLTKTCTFPPNLIFSSLGENVALLGAFSVGLQNLIDDA